MPHADSDVREAMDDAVFYGFIKPEPGYALPDKFAMFTPEGDRVVREVLAWFLSVAREAAERAGLNTFHKRLRAFQNLEVRTAQIVNDVTDERKAHQLMGFLRFWALSS